MNEQIHYEDNLFFLNRLVQFLKESRNLNLDSSFFHDKLKEEIVFIDKTTDMLYNELINNPHLVKRQEYLHGVMRLQQAFINLVADLPDSGILSREETEQLMQKHNTRASDIMDELRDKQDEAPFDQEVISNEEMSFLLQNSLDTGE